MRILITGGAGFIGSALCRYYLSQTEHEVVNLDALTYAANQVTLSQLDISPKHFFVKADLREPEALKDAFDKYKPQGVIHLAAESHVDRSIDGPGDFIYTNIVGTFNILQATRQHYDALKSQEQEKFRFLQVSTDEVYGSLEAGEFFTEKTSYSPNSPYSASKAAADHLSRAWLHTFKLPTLISNCSNNYGPWQFPEKLIPLMILKALAGEKLPIYGDGSNERDWLYVDDHAQALALVFEKGMIGEKYNIGGHNVIKNIEVVQMVCDLMDELHPRADASSHQDLMTYVADRPGHDRRYAIDASKIEKELGWKPEQTFTTGLKNTVKWYLENEKWWKGLNGEASQRLGLL